MHGYITAGVMHRASASGGLVLFVTRMLIITVCFRLKLEHFCISLARERVCTCEKNSACSHFDEALLFG
jgi:hypothetical protein